MFKLFVDNDVRKDRKLVPITEESLINRFSSMLPKDVIDGVTVLDLGSAAGAAGKWCLEGGAKSYTGIELQDEYYRISKTLLPQGEFIQSDVVEFLRSTDRQWETVIAAGLIHGYFNPFEVISLICKVATDTIIIESVDTHESNIPTIHFRPTNMINAEDLNKPYHGITTFIGASALELIMNEYGWVGKRIYPEPITSGIDAYNHMIKWHPDLPEQKMRYIYQFTRSFNKQQSLQSKIHVGI